MTNKSIGSRGLLQDKNKLAVLLVDMQREFVQELRLGEVRHIIPRQRELLRRSRQLDLPVVAVKMRPQDYGPIVEEIDNILRTVPRVFRVSKPTNDAFYRTKLSVVLAVLGVSALLLAGINAEYCVQDTAESALAFGYKIIVCNDFVAGQDDHNRHNGRPWFKANGLWLANSRQLFGELR